MVNKELNRFQVNLSSVAVIRSGLVLSRRKVEKNLNGVSYKLLTLRAFDENSKINVKFLDDYEALCPLEDEYLTHPGDIVVRLSSPYTAVLITKETSNLVISSNFLIIRCGEKILPEFLVWYLNTNAVKSKITKNTTSIMLGAIRPQFFNDLKLALPPIAEQKKIAQINSLAKKEIELLTNLIEQKKKYYDYILNFDCNSKLKDEVEK